MATFYKVETGPTGVNLINLKKKNGVKNYRKGKDNCPVAKPLTSKNKARKASWTRFTVAQEYSGKSCTATTL